MAQLKIACPCHLGSERHTQYVEVQNVTTMGYAALHEAEALGREQRKAAANYWRPLRADLSSTRTWLPTGAVGKSTWYGPGPTEGGERGNGTAAQNPK